MRYSSSKAAFASGQCDSRGYSYESPRSSGFSGFSGFSGVSETLHYRKDGGLDMRYSSSKAASAAGNSDIWGSSYDSPRSSGVSPTMHYRKDGGLDMRYSSSKVARDEGRCDSRGFGYDSSDSDESPCTPSVSVNAAAKSPKELDGKFRYTGQTKRGNKEEGTEACHIVSHEVMSAVLRHTPGRSYGERQQEQIARAVNSDKNLRIKSFDGNRYGSDGYSGDRYHDQKIVSAIDSKSPDGKVITNANTVKRIEQIWKTANEKLDLPPSVRQAIRDQLSQLRDKDGHVIIRANAKVNGY